MYKKNVHFYIVVICFVFISNYAGASDLPYKEGELVVRFAPKTNGKQRALSEKNEVLSSINGGTVKHSYKLVPGLTVVKLPPQVDVKDAVANFNKVQGILYAEPDYEIQIASRFPNDTRFNELWGMHNTGQSGGTPDAKL